MDHRKGVQKVGGCARLLLFPGFFLAMAARAGMTVLVMRRGLAAAAGRVTIGSEPTRRRKLAPKAVISVTENAAERIRELLENRQKREPDVSAVRVGIKSRGCNGLSYTMGYAAEKAKFEEEVEMHGVKVFVEPKALMHVIGTTMDFVEDDLSSEFVFHNPNAEAACGCGESFTVGKK